MKIHYLQHVPFEGLGRIRTWAEATEAEVTVTRLYENEVFPDMDAFDWLIVMGGPMGVHDDQRFAWLKGEKQFIERSIAEGKVVIGICLGAQIIAQVLGARVYPNAHREIGWFPVEPTPAALKSAAFKSLKDAPELFHWHGDTFDLPDGAVHMARTRACENQAFAYDGRVYGLQFHLETTEQGARALIEQCGDEIVDGPFIQTPEKILADPRRFNRIHMVMDRFLDGVANAGKNIPPEKEDIHEG